jgi:AraC-like DNA-binding protein/Tfp pilus assembly protein PilF/TolB-like protein
MSVPLTPDQIFISKLTEIVLSNLENRDFGVKNLAHEINMSPSGLNRRLQRIAKKNINQFIREVRLHKALEMLQNESVTASEVAYKAGFSSPAYFSTCFNEYFGFSPGKAKQERLSIPEEDIVTHFTSKMNQKGPESQTHFYPKAWIFVISGLILIASVFLYQKIFKPQTLDDLRSSDGRISVAVLPFNNMTDARIWDEIQNNIISYLSNFEELKVRQKEAVNILPEVKGMTDYASISPSLVRTISRKLDVNVFISGVVNRAGSVVRINANLINSKTNEVYKSFQKEGLAEGENIFRIMDSVSVLVSDFLIKSKMEKEVSPDIKPYRNTNSPEAFQFLVEADDNLRRYDIAAALKLYSKAVAIDSNYIPAIIFLSMRYKDLGKYEEAKKWCINAYSKRDRMNKNERIMADWYYSTLFGDPNDEIRYLKQYQNADDQVPISYSLAGYAYLRLFQYDKAIPEFLKTLDIYKKWGVKPMSQNYILLGTAYHKTGQYNKERKIYKKAEKDFPDDPFILSNQAVLSLTETDTIAANRYIEKLISVLQGKSSSEADISTKLAGIYDEADIPDKAEGYYRQAVSFQPDNPAMINSLAYFLIENNRNINEGLDLTDRILEKYPENYDAIHYKGWALYKQGNDREALKFLQKADSLKPIYNYTLYLHLQEVKKVVAGQK